MYSARVYSSPHNGHSYHTSVSKKAARFLLIIDIENGIESNSQKNKLEKKNRNCACGGEVSVGPGKREVLAQKNQIILFSLVISPPRDRPNFQEPL